MKAAHFRMANPDELVDWSRIDGITRLKHARSLRRRAYLSYHILKAEFLRALKSL